MSTSNLQVGSTNGQLLRSYLMGTLLALCVQTMTELKLRHMCKNEPAQQNGDPLTLQVGLSFDYRSTADCQQLY